MEANSKKIEEITEENQELDALIVKLDERFEKVKADWVDLSHEEANRSKSIRTQVLPSITVTRIGSEQKYLNWEYLDLFKQLQGIRIKVETV